MSYLNITLSIIKEKDVDSDYEWQQLVELADQAIIKPAILQRLKTQLLLAKKQVGFIGLHVTSVAVWSGKVNVLDCIKHTLLCPAVGRKRRRALFNSTTTKNPQEHYSELSAWRCWQTGQWVGASSSTVQPDRGHPEHSKSNTGLKKCFIAIILNK